jgi:LuxR family transcriptional regulator
VTVTVVTPREFCASLAASTTFDTSMDVLHDTVARLGFDAVAYSHMTSPRRADGRWNAPPLAVRNYPRGWDRLWWDRYTTHDPYFHACFEGSLSVDWSEVQRRNRLTTIQRESCRYLADQRLGMGLTIPLHLPHGRFGFVSAVVDVSSDAEWQRLRDDTSDAMFLIAHCFHAFVANRFGSPFPPRNDVGLTERERECLGWVACGKTSAEIAQIIGRAEETVRVHVKNAMRKLAVTSRAQAVIAAEDAGLLPDHAHGPR